MYHCTPDILNSKIRMAANSTRHLTRNKRIHVAYRPSTLRRVRKRHCAVSARLIFGEPLPQPRVTDSHRGRDGSATPTCMQSKMSTRASLISCNPNLRRARADAHQRLVGRKKDRSVRHILLLPGLTRVLHVESIRPEAHT